MRGLLALLPLAALVTGAGASPLCKDVAVRGKPPCPPETTAVCTTRTYCLTSQFPVVGYQVCEAWVCKPIPDAAAKGTPAK